MQQRSLRAELYFGANIPKGGVVAQSKFNEWVAQAAPWDGYTVELAQGSWKGESEPTRVLIVYGPNDDIFADQVAQLAASYRDTFHQESVAYAFVPAQFHLSESASHTATIYGDGVIQPSQAIAASELPSANDNYKVTETMLERFGNVR